MLVVHNVEVEVPVFQVCKCFLEELHVLWW